MTRRATTRQLIKRGLKPLESTPSGRSAGARGRRSDYPWIAASEWVPPQAVQANAEEGLALRAYAEEELGRSRPGGTDIGVARAVQLSRGKPVWPRTIKRMASYFARHEPDKRASRWGDFERPSPGFVAWLLWGGDEGRAWAQRLKGLMAAKGNPMRQPTVSSEMRRFGFEKIETGGGNSAWATTDGELELLVTDDYGEEAPTCRRDVAWVMLVPAEGGDPYWEIKMWMPEFLVAYERFLRDQLPLGQAGTRIM